VNELVLVTPDWQCVHLLDSHRGTKEKKDFFAPPRSAACGPDLSSRWTSSKPACETYTAPRQLSLFTNCSADNEGESPSRPWRESL
jgi:hypothetical protein